MKDVFPQCIETTTFKKGKSTIKVKSYDNKSIAIHHSRKRFYLFTKYYNVFFIESILTMLDWKITNHRTYKRKRHIKGKNRAS